VHIGLIGLGAMGSGMADNLAKSEHSLHIWNRTPSKAQQFAKMRDVQVELSISELAEKCELILLCVSADEDVLAVVHELLRAILPNTTVVDTSTVSSATAREAARLLTIKQAYFLDAPVSGGVEGAKNGSLVMMVGGDQSVLKRVTPALKCFCARIVYMGEAGAGQGTKAVNQIMAAGINQAVTEALAFAEAEGLPLDKVIDVVSGGAAGNWFLTHRGLSMVEGRYETGFKLALHYKDLKICQAMAEKNLADLALVDKTIADYQLLIQQGWSDADISALYCLK